jgi:hypothetical protein
MKLSSQSAGIPNAKSAKSFEFYIIPKNIDSIIERGTLGRFIFLTSQMMFLYIIFLELGESFLFRGVNKIISVVFHKEIVTELCNPDRVGVAGRFANLIHCVGQIAI